MHYEELVKEHAPVWPYPVNYGKENEVSCDVLVLGGGVGGCWAAIAAAKKGARVVLVDKGVTKSSGGGGSGVDHWGDAPTNPASKITPEEYAQALIDSSGGYTGGIGRYILCRESYDRLLDLEKMGMKIRDSEDEFKGAEFRDEKTKLLFAFDYSGKCNLRVWGHNVKLVLDKELRRLGVQIFDRVMVTSLLNKGGKQGAAVVGATGVNTRTGEFYIFKGKASVISMSTAHRNWVFSTELYGLSNNIGVPANNSGDGNAMAWKAGAEFIGLEQSSRGSPSGPYSFPANANAKPAQSWYACTMVDANGKEIPWVDRDGRILKTVSERYQPAPGQKFFLREARRYEYQRPQLIPGWQQRVHEGEFTLPIYGDLSSMPEIERKVIWGMMMAQEGRVLIPLYWTYNHAGFDPDKDMIQSYYGGSGGLGESDPPIWRQAGGGVVTDWDLKTNLEGLYAAGGQTVGGGSHPGAAATGSYAGRRAADYAVGASELAIDRKQVEAEKARVYAPVQRKSGLNWKELNSGVCKVMQSYCGEVKNEELLKLGLKWIDELEAGEATEAYARNPHELTRLLEVFSIMDTSRMILEACRARKESNTRLGFKRSDYPEVDSPEWRKWVTIKLDEGKVKIGELPLDYHGDTKDLRKNYEAHCGL